MWRRRRAVTWIATGKSHAQTVTGETTLISMQLSLDIQGIVGGGG